MYKEEEDMHELDERKMKILKAIIKTYLESGEPVGSRTISKFSDLKLSSATIRNEMSDLEDMGYIVQPHTSAGRIPSDKGYRLYVDAMMRDKEEEVIKREEEVSQMQEIMIQKADKMEEILKQVAKVLASNTNYAAMISSPKYNKNKLKFIQLSNVDENQILAVIVVEGNIIKNTMMEVEGPLDNETLLKLNLLLNTNLNGLSIEEINLGMITTLKEQAGIHSGLVSDVLDAVAGAIKDEDDLEIYTSGATNIFKYPELSDSNKAMELISAFEEKQQLTELFSNTLNGDENKGIQIYIGEESPVSNMRDCSLVTATYELGEGMKGTIGIVGPKRMDYDNVISNIKTLMTQMEDIFKKT